jgi:hypothetical protein
MDIQIFIDQFLQKLQQQFKIPAKKEWNKEWNKEEVFFCLYTFKIGHKKGTMCAKKLKNGEYCSSHKSKIVHLKPEPIILPKTNIARYHQKIQKYVHEPTRLVFFSKDKQIVYGKISIYDERIIPLCDKDIEQCKKYFFEYDEKLYKHCL